MRVMGIDPGLTRCGLGVVDVDPSRRASLVYVGVARTDKDLATHFRLRTIADAIDSVIEQYQPEVVAIERVFAQDNLQSVTATMQVMGAAMTCVGRAGLPMAVHTPSEVKSAVSGNGNADKAQVQTMVARILGLAKAPKPGPPDRARVHDARSEGVGRGPGRATPHGCRRPEAQARLESYICSPAVSRVSDQGKDSSDLASARHRRKRRTRPH